ncbi:MAG: arginine deiminase family protein [Tenuifilaceae bacterium]|nr:arginine deiminase family protein [Tenuifilaceae bacterium]
MSKLTKAIVRKPGKNFANGISTSNLGKPSFELALEQHAAYREALKQCGIDVIVLEADERYPDGCFVEDTAVVTNEAAIITRPGDPSRLGEEESILQTISKLKKIERITAPGNLEGGDILRVEKNFYIGITKRTNVEGAKQLAQFLSKYGYNATQIPVKDILHLKTGIAYLGNDNFIGVDELRGIAQGKNMIKVQQDEEYSANCLRVNDNLIIPKGFPKSKSQIVSLGYNIIELDMSEFRKMDGGLTCLSLLF